MQDLGDGRGLGRVPDFWREEKKSVLERRKKNTGLPRKASEEGVVGKVEERDLLLKFKEPVVG